MYSLPSGARSQQKVYMVCLKVQLHLHHLYGRNGHGGLVSRERVMQLWTELTTSSSHNYICLRVVFYNVRILKYSFDFKSLYLILN